MRTLAPRTVQNILNLAGGQETLVGHHPPSFGFLVSGVQLAGEIPQTLPSVVKIDDLDGAGELFLADVPDPVGPVSHDDLDPRPIPAALMGFGP